MNTSQNNDYWFNEVNANKRVVNGVTYTAEHWLFNDELLHWGKYTRLVKTLPDRDSIVLFDTKFNIPLKTLTIAIIGISLLLAVIFIVIKKQPSDNKSQTPL